MGVSALRGPIVIPEERLKTLTVQRVVSGMEMAMQPPDKGYEEYCKRQMLRQMADALGPAVFWTTTPSAPWLDGIVHRASITLLLPPPGEVNGLEQLQAERPPTVQGHHGKPPQPRDAQGRYCRGPEGLAHQ